MLGRFMTGVMKWTICDEITNMCVIKLEYDERLINIIKTPKTLTQVTMMGLPYSLVPPLLMSFCRPWLMKINDLYPCWNWLEKQISKFWSVICTLMTPKMITFAMTAQKFWRHHWRFIWKVSLYPKLVKVISHRMLGSTDTRQQSATK